MDTHYLNTDYKLTNVLKKAKMYLKSINDQEKI